MFEAFLNFIRELLFKNEIIDIRNPRFNVFKLLPKLIVIGSFLLNYYLINKYIDLASRHFNLELIVENICTTHRSCSIEYDYKKKDYELSFPEDARDEAKLHGAKIKQSP